jgi:hypothetical protein
MNFQAGDVVHTVDGMLQIVDITGDSILARNPNSNNIKQYNIKEAKNWMSKNNVYNVTVQSPFILTPRQVKEKFGIGFKVLSVETEKDIPQVVIKDIDSAVENIIRVGYRSLARANHPDLGGDAEVMVILNKAKKEIIELMESLK